jgi:hypothetical protein
VPFLLFLLVFLAPAASAEKLKIPVDENGVALALIEQVKRPRTLAGAAAEYYAELASNAGAAGLHDDPYWRLLLRYRWFGGETPSNVFYFARKGRRDPAEELAATLKAFFDPPTADPVALHPQCIVPARYEWLKEKLGFDSARLPERACPELERWRDAVDPASVTMVFAAAFLNSPASMYGHTFLRLDKRGAGKSRRLLDYTLNFAAYNPDSNPVLYAFRGLTGGYKGRFSLLPYYMKVQEYTNMESRDLWEYKLRLDDAALRRLVNHAWELGSVFFPYYFFNRNCSYQLLPLIDAAEPALRLTPGWRIGVIPSDTLRWTIEGGATTGEPVYRPSRLTMMRTRRAALDKRERSIAKRLVEGAFEEALGEAAALPPEREALVLDAASEFLLYKDGSSVEIPDAVRERETVLLARRGKLAAKPVPVRRPEWAAAPHEGHPTTRATLGFGATDGATFQEIALRMAMHDHLDRPDSYPAGGMLTMGDFRFRYDDDRERLYPHKATLLDIFSIFPWDPWVREPSWKVRTGLATADEYGGDPRKSLYWELRGGRGLAYESGFLRREIAYVFLDADAGFGGVFRDRYRFGVGGTGGLTVNATRRYRLWFEASYIPVFLGDTRDLYSISLGQQFDLAERVALRAELTRRRERREVFGALLWYF